MLYTIIIQSHVVINCINQRNSQVMKLMLSIDVFREHKLNLKTLEKMAQNLQICPVTISTALKFIYKSYEYCRCHDALASLHLNELYMSALFLASKVNERFLKLRDIINAYCVYSGRGKQVMQEKVGRLYLLVELAHYYFVTVQFYRVHL